MRAENDRLKTEWNTKEETLKTLTQKVRDEKSQLEKTLYQTEFLVKEKIAEAER